MADLVYTRDEGYWASEFYATDGAVVYTSGNAAGYTPFVFGTGDWTIEMWVYNESLVRNAMTLIDFRSGQDGYYPVLYVNQNGYLVYRMNSGDRITGATRLPRSQWNHVVLCRVSGVTRIFLNGVQQGANYSDTLSHTAQNSSYPVLIARTSMSNTGTTWNGLITSLAITKGVGYYNSDFTPPGGPMVSSPSASLLTCLDSTLVDRSQYNYTVAPYTSSATVSTQTSMYPTIGGVNADSTTLISSLLKFVSEANKPDLSANISAIEKSAPLSMNFINIDFANLSAIEIGQLVTNNLIKTAFIAPSKNTVLDVAYLPHVYVPPGEGTSVQLITQYWS